MAFALKISTLYKNDNTGRELELPALLTEDGLLISHLRFLASPRYLAMSPPWRERNIFAVRLLLRYIHANEGVFQKTTELLKSFAVALEYGTINVETQLDPSNLYWTPRNAEDARTLLGHITQYTDWLAGEPAYAQERSNPFRKATSVEERMNWCAYYHKEANVFLAHLHHPDGSAEQNRLVRTVRGSDVPIFRKRPTKRFPEKEFQTLLNHGWTRLCGDPKASEHARIDYKGRAITLLMNKGGLRKSEIFHLYLQDVIIDRKRNEAIVRIYHPSEGRSPEKGYSNRQDYLNRRYRMQPRNQYATRNSLHAGWKAPLLTDGPDGYIEVHFFPISASQEFLYNFIMYLEHQRVDPMVHEDHPYAFTNTEGRPETIKNFNRQHRDAVNRIGLEHRKLLGTTEHGHRHAYGYRLAEAGMSGIVIQKAMHHKNAESHKVYTEANDEDVRDAFERADRKMTETDVLKSSSNT